MSGRELGSKLNYLGMCKGIRKIALDDKLAPVEDLAIMSIDEVCNLVAPNYQLVYAENEEIGLVHNDKAEELFNLIKVVSK